MKKVSIVLVLMFVIGFLGGCEWIETSGTGKRYFRLDPNEAQKYEEGVEGAMGIMTVLLPLLPWLAPVVTGVGGVLAVYKKMKPKLVASEKEKDNFVRGGEILALVLEEVKTKHAEVWEDVGPSIKKLVKNSASIENAIRGFRHLASK